MRDRFLRGGWRGGAGGRAGNGGVESATVKGVEWRVGQWAEVGGREGVCVNIYVYLRTYSNILDHVVICYIHTFISHPTHIQLHTYIQYIQIM